MVMQCKESKAGKLSNLCKRVFHLAKENSEKILEKNLSGENVSHLAIKYNDDYTSLLIFQMMDSINQIEDKDSIGRLFDYSVER